MIAWEKVLFISAAMAVGAVGLHHGTARSDHGRLCRFQNNAKGQRRGPCCCRAVWCWCIPFLSLGCLLPVLLVPDATEARGFYLLCLFGGILYGLCVLAIVLGHFAENGCQPSAGGGFPSSAALGSCGVDRDGRGLARNRRAARAVHRGRTVSPDAQRLCGCRRGQWHAGPCAHRVGYRLVDSRTIKFIQEGKIMKTQLFSTAFTIVSYSGCSKLSGGDLSGNRHLLAAPSGPHLLGFTIPKVILPTTRMC